jgi:HrpA-like RNA helicase
MKYFEGKLLFPQFDLLHSYCTCGYFQYTTGGWFDKTKFYPLYGLLTNDEQAKAIAPSRTGQRKVVLATPIAETSLTCQKTVDLAQRARRRW